MKITQEERERQYRLIYGLLCETPRIYVQDISEKLKINPLTAKLRLKEAHDFQYIVGPEIRKRSFKNLKEYMYFIKCNHPEIPYLTYREDMNVVYHAKTRGFCDLWIISKKKLDIEGTIIHEGYRSDYYVSYAPDRTWDTSREITRKRIRNFDPEEFTPKHFIETHFHSMANWRPKDEFLYRYFKYNLRKPVSPLLKDHKIYGKTIYNFFEKLPQCCTIFTDYFPDGLPSYDPYLFMVETDYEDFVIDLFSQFPTSASFFKVSDKLFVYVNIPKEVIRGTDLQVNLNKLYIPLLFMDMLKKGIIRNKDDVLVDYSIGKSL
jgi:hypothetical protein